MEKSLGTAVALGTRGRGMQGKGRRLFWSSFRLTSSRASLMAGERPNRPVTYWSRMEEKSCWQEAGCVASKWAWASLWEAWKGKAGCSNAAEEQVQALELSRVKTAVQEGPSPEGSHDIQLLLFGAGSKWATWLGWGQESWYLWNRNRADFQRERESSEACLSRDASGIHKLCLCLLLFAVKNTKCSLTN